MAVKIQLCSHRWAWGSGPGGDHVRSSRGGVDFSGSGGDTNFCSEGGKGGGEFSKKSEGFFAMTSFNNTKKCAKCSFK